MEKYCIFCGNTLNEDDLYCGECGKKIERTSTHLATNYEDIFIEEEFYHEKRYAPQKTSKAKKSHAGSHIGTHSKGNKQRPTKKKRILVGCVIVAIILTVTVANKIINYNSNTRDMIDREEIAVPTTTPEMVTDVQITQKDNSPVYTLPISEEKTEEKPFTGLANDPAMVQSAYNLLVHGGQFGDIYFARYYIYDMNGDGIEEIIIIAGTCEADSALLVYTYRNGAFENIGSANGSHCSICANTKGTGIIAHHGSQGYEYVEALIIKDNVLNVETLISDHFVDGNYTEFDYCLPLNFYAINDTSPFLNMLK